MPYTFGCLIGGEQEAKVTFFAPASRAMMMISLEVVPLTIESSTSMTCLPSNSECMAFSFLRTACFLMACPGMMKVRPMYLFLMNPSR